MLYNEEKYAGAEVQDGYCLSEISDFQGLLPKAYNAGVPVFAVSDRDINETGSILANLVAKRKIYKKLFSSLAKKIELLVN